MASALSAGKTSHPTIAKAWHEAEMWQRYGVHVDERAAPDRPWREVREYMALTDVTVAKENAARDKAARARG